MAFAFQLSAVAAPIPLVKAPQVDTPTHVLFIGNSYDYFGRIDKDTAAFLQQVAEDTVKAFYGRQL